MGRRYRGGQGSREREASAGEGRAARCRRQGTREVGGGGYIAAPGFTSGREEVGGVELTSHRFPHHRTL